MLIGVGFKLASPKEFGRMASIGIEQLIIFLTTIVVTLSTDLLVGIAAGIVVKLITQMVFGAPLKTMFKASVEISGHNAKINGSAVFSNWLGIKKQLIKFNLKDHVVVDVRNCNVVDHTVIDNLLHMEHDFENEGGKMDVIGLDEFEVVSKKGHLLSARKRSKATKIKF